MWFGLFLEIDPRWGMEIKQVTEKFSEKLDIWQ
jgi:hypothetical protein